jgi:hypothetical protein
VNPLEQQLLRAEIGEAEPSLCIRSGTRVDAGRWWRRSPVWICVTDDALILLAVARRRFLARIALPEARASRYHHASGELVVEPGETLPFNRFKLSVHDALRILHHLQTHSEAQPHHPTNPPC